MQVKREQMRILKLSKLAGAIGYTTKLIVHLLREYWTYVGLALVVVCAFAFKEELARSLGVGGIEIELLGALLIYFLVDIPLRLRSAKIEGDNRKKARLVIESKLAETRVILLQVLFDYLYLSTNHSVADVIEIVRIEQLIGELDFKNTVSHYISLGSGEEIKLSLSNDAAEIVSERDLRRGYRVPVYLYITDGKVARFPSSALGEFRLLGFEDLANRLRICEQQLEEFIGSFLPILTMDEIGILSDLSNAISRSLKYTFPRQPETMKDDNYKIITLSILHDLRTPIFVHYTRLASMMNAKPSLYAK